MFAEMEERKVTPMPIQKVVRLGVAREAIWVSTRANAHKKGAVARCFLPGALIASILMSSPGNYAF